uniref:cilia- and flagella-associated protein 300-like n=1 Tax=Styela clava TaxID=7725 RepID=UPI00193A3BA3|nr:cilia- and flagella-associated protein 300-like [Styela clava]
MFNGMESEHSHKFKVISKKLSTLLNKDFKVYLEKWYLLDRLRAWTFSFDKQFPAYAKDKFCLDFMNDSEVLSIIQCMNTSGSWSPLVTKVSSVDVEEVPCTQLSMDFFNRLKEYNIVRESGHISKCFDEFHEGITISDELRKMLLLEDSNNFESYSDEERSEFLFRMFSHICIGGSICQYEDMIEPYYEVTKSLYKDCVSVQKDSSTNEIKIVSKVFKITAKDEEGTIIYPSSGDHIQNFAYLIVEPFKRHVTLLYHSWGKGLW